MKHLIFKVNSQSLQRVDKFKPAAGSVGYLTASFEFDSDWSGTTKTAKCRAGTAIYDAVISSDGSCVIPWEVLTVDKEKQIFGKQDFYIWVEGINGTKTITTDEAKVELNVQGAGSEQNAGDPTPSTYAQFVADVTAATKANADIATAQAWDAEASAESATASAASLRNDYSNALKGNASGAVIRLDDVSPVEHFPFVKVHGKNMFNINALEVMPENYTVRISAIDTDNNTFVITTEEAHTGNGYCGLTNGAGNYAPTLRDICPHLKVGKTYVLSGNTDTKTRTLYLREAKKSWVFGTALTITEEHINSKIAMYGLNSADGEGTGDCVISNLQIEEGNTATEYTPYVDPSTVTVTDSNGNTYTPNADGTVEGITSTMIKNGISTDTEGMTIDCEYNRDINKVIADIYTQLAGG